MKTVSFVAVVQLVLILRVYFTRVSSLNSLSVNAGVLKNICFDSSRHSWLLLNDDVDVLSYILLPLAGPEEFTAEDNDMFPTDLQVSEANGCWNDKVFETKVFFPALVP